MHVFRKFSAFMRYFTWCDIYDIYCVNTKKKKLNATRDMTTTSAGIPRGCCLDTTEQESLAVYKSLHLNISMAHNGDWSNNSRV